MHYSDDFKVFKEEIFLRVRQGVGIFFDPFPDHGHDLAILGVLISLRLGLRLNCDLVVFVHKLFKRA
jgi:hypothetical protein